MQTGTVIPFAAAPQPLPTEQAIPNTRLVMAPWQVRCLQGYIAAHLHTTIRTVDLARMAEMGPFRLKRAFKESFGCTPHQYVIRMRVERAQRLMSIRVTHSRKSRRNAALRGNPTSAICSTKLWASVRARGAAPRERNEPPALLIDPSLRPCVSQPRVAVLFSAVSIQVTTVGFQTVE